MLLAALWIISEYICGHTHNPTKRFLEHEERGRALLPYRSSYPDAQPAMHLLGWYRADAQAPAWFAHS